MPFHAGPVCSSIRLRWFDFRLPPRSGSQLPISFPSIDLHKGRYKAETECKRERLCTTVQRCECFCPETRSARLMGPSKDYPMQSISICLAALRLLLWARHLGWERPRRGTHRCPPPPSEGVSPEYESTSILIYLCADICHKHLHES